MNLRSNLPLVALVSFGLGMAVDRVVFPSGEENADGSLSEADGQAKSPARARAAGEGLRGSGGSRRSRDDRSSRDENRDGDEGGIPAAVRRMVEGMERGDRIDAATVESLLKQLPAGQHRHNLMHHVASLWGRQDPEAAVEWAEGLSADEQWTALEGILHGWAEHDPAGAADYVAQLPNSEHSLHMVRRVAHLWAEQDREAAIAWGMSQTDPATRQRALGGVIEFWGRGDPAAAAAFASTLESPYERNEVLEVAARRWARQDFADAMEWAQALPAADQQRATRAILREVAERDPGRAATIYEEMTGALTEESLQAGGYRRLAQEIASIWSRSSPQEAATWAQGLPEEGEVRRAAIADVAEHWLRLDSMAAGEWILQLPEGRTRDAAAERVVGSMMHSEPASAFAWASSLSDEGHRTGMMREVLERWSASDPGAAEAALRDVSLSAHRRRELEEVFGGGGSPPLPEGTPGPEAGNEEGE